MNEVELFRWFEPDKYYCVVRGNFFLHVTNHKPGETVLDVYDSVTHKLKARLPANSTKCHSSILASKEDHDNFVRIDKDTIKFRTEYSDVYGMVFRRSKETILNYDRLTALLDIGVDVNDAIRMSVEEKEN